MVGQKGEDDYQYDEYHQACAGGGGADVNIVLLVGVFLFAGGSGSGRSGGGCIGHGDWRFTLLARFGAIRSAGIFMGLAAWGGALATSPLRRAWACRRGFDDAPVAVQYTGVPDDADATQQPAGRDGDGLIAMPDNAEIPMTRRSALSLGFKAGLILACPAWA